MKKSDKKRTRREVKPGLQFALQRQRALARWDNEGGAACLPLQTTAPATDSAAATSTTTGSEMAAATPWASAECQQLHGRLIALENLVISLLAMGNKPQLALARDMAGHIAARPGAAPHRLTEQAAKQLVHLVGRAAWFRTHT